MHPSGEIGRFEVDNLSSPPGYFGRSAVEKLSRSLRPKGEHIMILRCLLGVTVFAMSATSVHSQIDSAQPRLGSFVGQFLYDGEPPTVKRLPGFDEITLDKPPTHEPTTGRLYGFELSYREYLQRGVRPRTLDESLLVSRDGGIANVIVFVSSADIPMPESHEPQMVTLQIKDGQFAPRVLGGRRES